VKSAFPSRTGRKKVTGAPLRQLSFAAPARLRKRQPAAKAEVYWDKRPPVDFYTFDDNYLRLLGSRDPATEAHFVAYFSERLRITLRARGIDSHTIEDVRQETFCRVLVAVRAGNVNNSGGFGAYVYAVCKHVLSESRRDNLRYKHDDLESTDVPDDDLGLEERIQRQENGKHVRAILAALPERDRHLLQARFFEDRDNDEVCGDFGVDRDYLRVLIHRALHKFGELYKKRIN
jgi:RNA polymerase sigma-70 factor, ECF subfamily